MCLPRPLKSFLRCCAKANANLQVAASYGDGWLGLLGSSSYTLAPFEASITWPMCPKLTLVLVNADTFEHITQSCLTKGSCWALPELMVVAGHALAYIVLLYIRSSMFVAVTSVFAWSLSSKSCGPILHKIYQPFFCECYTLNVILDRVGVCTQVVTARLACGMWPAGRRCQQGEQSPLPSTRYTLWYTVGGRAPAACPRPASSWPQTKHPPSGACMSCSCSFSCVERRHVMTSPVDGPHLELPPNFNSANAACGLPPRVCM